MPEWGVGQPAAAGVHSEVAAGRGTLIGDEVGAFTRSAEAEAFEGNKYGCR